ncbi:hypothetical protein PJM23_29115, partial [Mycobacterium kansasii]
MDIPTTESHLHDPTVNITDFTNGSSIEQVEPALRWNKNHPPELVIGDPTASLRTRTTLTEELENSAFISQIEP